MSHSKRSETQMSARRAFADKAMLLQGQDYHSVEFDSRGGHIRSSQACSQRALTLCARHRHFFRWTVCFVRYPDQLLVTTLKVDSANKPRAMLKTCLCCHTGSWDGTLRLWDLNSGNTTRRFIGHTKDVLSVAFSVDNRQVWECCSPFSMQHALLVWKT